MEIKQLFYFLEIWRLQSFTEAARNCFITPQGIHISIARLEEEIGKRLFIRTNDGLMLTPAGEYLLPKAEEIVRLQNEASDHFAREAEKERIVPAHFVRGTVELLALPSIAAFKEQYSDSDVRFKVDQDVNCMQAVLNGEADFAVCSGPVQFKDLSARLLFSKKNVLVINKKHPLAKNETVSIDDLKYLNMALPRENTSIHNTVLKLCRDRGFDLQFEENDEPRTAFNCAEIGLQAGIVNEISAGKLLKDAPNVVTIPFKEPEMSWDVFLIKKKNMIQTAVSKKYEAFLLATAKNVL